MHASLHAVDDRTVSSVLVKWLAVVAPHLTLQSCVDAAHAALRSGRSLASLLCLACSALHLDAGAFASMYSIFARSVLPKLKLPPQFRATL